MWPSHLFLYLCMMLFIVRKSNTMKLQRSTVYLFMGVAFVLFLLLVIDIKLKFDGNTTHLIPTTSTASNKQQKKESSKLECKGKTYCKNVLASATNGYWSRQSSDIYTMWKQDSVEKIREKLGIPINMSRADFRWVLYSLLFFQILCIIQFDWLFPLSLRKTVEPDSTSS